MSDLIPPHGGLSGPVDRNVPANETADFKAKATALPRVPVSDADLSTLYRLGDGGLSPLTGPMGKEAYQRVLDEEVVLHNGQRYAWTIPLSFPVDEKLAKLNAELARTSSWFSALSHLIYQVRLSTYRSLRLVPSPLEGEG
jgi:sulfate adenylyltransferase